MDFLDESLEIVKVISESMHIRDLMHLHLSCVNSRELHLMMKTEDIHVHLELHKALHPRANPLKYIQHKYTHN